MSSKASLMAQWTKRSVWNINCAIYAMAPRSEKHRPPGPNHKSDNSYSSLFQIPPFHPPDLYPMFFHPPLCSALTTVPLCAGEGQGTWTWAWAKSCEWQASCLRCQALGCTFHTAEWGGSQSPEKWAGASAFSNKGTEAQKGQMIYSWSQLQRVWLCLSGLRCLSWRPCVAARGSSGYQPSKRSQSQKLT